MDRRRHLLLLLAAAGALSACGFKLRGALDFAFDSVYINAPAGSSIGDELRRSLAGSGTVKVLGAGERPEAAQVVLDLLGDQREKVVVGRTSAGQVREFQLRNRIKFRLRTPQGGDLIPETELAQQRDISYNESAALAKESEENLLYRNMQSELVQQLMRRLAAIKTL